MAKFRGDTPGAPGSDGIEGERLEIGFHLLQQSNPIVQVRQFPANRIPVDQRNVPPALHQLASGQGTSGQLAQFGDGMPIASDDDRFAGRNSVQDLPAVVAQLTHGYLLHGTTCIAA